MKKKIGSLQLKAAIMVVIGILILGKILFSVYDRYALVKMLREQGIYEISFSYVQVDERIEAHYLICEPPNNNQDISKNILQFPALTLCNSANGGKALIFRRFRHLPFGRVIRISRRIPA